MQKGYIENKTEECIINKTYVDFYISPIGLIKITGIDNAIIGVQFLDREEKSNTNEDLPEQIRICKKQLDEYFKGTRKDFSLNIRFTKGTEFQKKVWNALLEIPYGNTASYKEIAKAVGNEKAARAVGNANNKNPISIIVPCHRVIGSDGSLVGYGGGLWRKKWLIEHEQERIRNCEN